jgi:hypothetical protein
VIGWHPAAWWLERQIDFEREAACDEIAVSVTGSAKGYATCLATLAARPESTLRPVAALAAASPCRLRARIVRILAAPCGAARPWRAITLAAGGGLLACALVVANVQLVASEVTSAVALTTEYATRPEPVVTHLPVASRSTEQTEPAPTPLAARRGGSRGSQRPATQQDSPRVEKTETIGEPLTPAAGSTPLQSSALPVDSSGSLTTTTAASEHPVQAAAGTPIPTQNSIEPRVADKTPAPWTRAADAGVGIGRASQTAGTATAGFFKRFGKKVAGAF